MAGRGLFVPGGARFQGQDLDRDQDTYRYSGRLSTTQWERIRPGLLALHQQGCTVSDMLTELHSMGVNVTESQFSSQMTSWGFNIDDTDSSSSLLKAPDNVSATGWNPIVDSVAGGRKADHHRQSAPSTMRQFLDENPLFAWPYGNYFLEDGLNTLESPLIFEGSISLWGMGGDRVDRYRMPDSNKFRHSFAVRTKSLDATRLPMVIEQIAATAKLRHPHITALLGARTKGRIFHIATYPRPCCDLEQFMESISKELKFSRDAADVTAANYSRHREPHFNDDAREGVTPGGIGFAHERRLRPEERWKINDLAKWFLCLCQGLAYLHRSGVRHGDVRPANIWIDMSGNVVLTDFGSNRSSGGQHERKDANQYSSRESVLRLGVDYASDVFSLGCVFSEMASLILSRDLDQFKQYRCVMVNGKRNYDFWRCPDRLQAWMEHLELLDGGKASDFNSTGALKKIQQMVSSDQGVRPTTNDLWQSFDLPLVRRCPDCHPFHVDRWMPYTVQPLAEPEGLHSHEPLQIAADQQRHSELHSAPLSESPRRLAIESEQPDPLWEVDERDALSSVLSKEGSRRPQTHGLMADDIESQSNIESGHDGPPTDSGYVSATKTIGHNEQESAALLGEDARTIYSDTSSVLGPDREQYLTGLADDLYSKVLSEQEDDEIAKQVCAVLPGLLKAFALKMGHDAPSQMHRDIMAFVHKSRDNVLRRFINNRHHKEEAPSEHRTREPERMPLTDLMADWQKRLDDVEDVSGSEHDPPLDIYAVEEEEEDDDDDDDDDDDNDDGGLDESSDEDIAPALYAYREAIVKTATYEWLVTSLRRECLLSKSPPNSMETIKQTIISALPPSRFISRKVSAEAYTVIFEVDWDPVAFIKQQEYRESPEAAIEAAITLTGTSADSQALPAVQYLCQTWPLTGRHTMGLVKSVVCSSPGRRHECLFPDRTHVAVWTSGSIFVVEASGTAESVAEIGQQFAWLGAALRSSSCDSGIVRCTPRISDIMSTDSTTERPSSQEAHFKMDFTMNEDEAGDFQGQCWQGLFRNPAVVQGYPIRRRAEPRLGLEIPLNMMAELVRSRYANFFSGALFVKAFSTILWTTRYIEGVLIWHLLYNENGDHISYHDSRITHAMGDDIPRSAAAARHIVGWCAGAKYCAGASDVNYTIGKSGLPKPHEGCMLEKVSISAGKIVTGGLTFAIGVKDVPLRVSREGYIPKLKWLSRHFVVLWDEDTKCGWLVNGTSALLHLLRASLEFSGSDKFKSAFLFKREDLREASEPGTADSAIEVLLNPINKALKMYPEKDGFLRFEDQVEQLYDALDKMIDHQISLAGRHGVNLKLRARKHLEGWDFKDLATDRDPLYPRVATIPAIGKGWVDFTRTIHAITLFGRGFGDLIRPTSPGELCSYWARLPRQKYYLGACVSDLKEIMELDGDAHSSPIKLCDDIFWHNPDITFEACQCITPTGTATVTGAGTELRTRTGTAKAKAKSETGNKPCDRAQVLLPTALKAVLPKRTPLALNDRAAVIFGHNMTFSWVFPDTGSPKRGVPPNVEEGLEVATEESDSQFHDSGIGSSLMSSSAATRGSGIAGVTATMSGSSLDGQSNSLGPIHSERTESIESNALEGSSTGGDDSAVSDPAHQATQARDQKQGQSRNQLQVQARTQCRSRSRSQSRWNLFRTLVKRRRDMVRE